MSDSEETGVESEAQDQEIVDKEKAQNSKTSAKDDEDKEPEAIPKIPAYVTCRLCSSVYKRAVKTPCCGYRACRACAVKQATKLKKCWNKKCGKPVATADLENDEVQRAKVEKYHQRQKQWEQGLKTGDLLKCSVCDEICKRGITMSCCGIAACRGCAVKKLTAKRKCWNETCAAIGITSDKLENDELLRTAIEHFKEKGEMDVGHAKKIAANRSKLNPEKINTTINTTKAKKTRLRRLASRQLPKNKDKKKADKKPTPAEKPSEKKMKPANKKKTSEKKQDQKKKPLEKKQNQKKKLLEKKQDQKKKPMVKRSGGSQMYGRQKNFMGQRGWQNGPRNGGGPWQQQSMGGSPFMRSNGMTDLKLAQENMQMKRLLMRMNNMAGGMAGSGRLSGSIWKDAGMGQQRNMTGGGMRGSFFNEYDTKMRRF